MGTERMTKGLSFCEWLRRQDGRNDRIGDLADDFRTDTESGSIRTFGGLHKRMLAMDACIDALETLEIARQEWRAGRAHTKDRPT